MYASAIALGLEGIFAKDSKSPYIEGPAENRYWLKARTRTTSGKSLSSFGRQRRGNDFKC